MVGGLPLENPDVILPMGFQEMFTDSEGQSVDQMATGFFKIGPRTVLTCGHCLFFKEQWYFNQTPLPLEYMIPVSEIQKINNPDRPIQSLTDFPNRMDIAILVIPKNIELPERFAKIKPLSIAKTSPQLQEEVYFAGNGSTKSTNAQGFTQCRGPKKWNYGKFQVTDLDPTYFAATGKDHGLGEEADSYTCGGDSGGLFFQVSQGNILLFGLNTTGTENSQRFAQNIWKGIPAFTSSGINLTSAAVRSWMLEVALKHEESICGINAECEPLPWLK